MLYVGVVCGVMTMGVVSETADYVGVVCESGVVCGSDLRLVLGVGVVVCW